jgi:hypothetical protein
MKRSRVAGAVVAAAISLSLTAVPRETIDLVGLGIVGGPLAALLAVWLTPAVAGASWRMAAAIGVAMGIGAAYLGVLELALLTLIASLLGFDPATGFGSDVTGALFIATVGLPFGTFVLPITIPCGLAWALVVRALALGGGHVRGQTVVVS